MACLPGFEADNNVNGGWESMSGDSAGIKGNDELIPQSITWNLSLQILQAFVFECIENKCDWMKILKTSKN